jgi:hypothetical protein
LIVALQNQEPWQAAKREQARKEQLKQKESRRIIEEGLPDRKIDKTARVRQR